MPAKSECVHCGKYLSQRQILRHTSNLRRNISDNVPELPRSTKRAPPEPPPASPTASNSHDNNTSTGDDNLEALFPVDGDALPLADDVPNLAAQVEDWVSDSDEANDGDMMSSWEESSDEENDVNNELGAEIDPQDLEEMLEKAYGQEWEKELHRLENDLITEEDIDNIRMYALRIEGLLSRTLFNKLRRMFTDKLSLSSEWVTEKRMEFLSGVSPKYYDCCINSCTLYIEDLANAAMCPFCKEGRYRADGKSRQRFAYLPIIPRLQAMYKNATIVKELSYRHSRQPSPRHSCDKFDGQHYKNLCKKKIISPHRSLNRKYFADRRDIALGLSADGMNIWKEKRRKGNPTCWPIILLNYNLSPEICNRLMHIICVGVIPGPKQPKAMGSYLIPLIDELIELLEGVSTYDITEDEIFDLHAFLISVFGDMPAIDKLLGIKGHNVFRPCRACLIFGILGPATTYYYPLEHPHSCNPDDPVQSFDPQGLPPQTSESFHQAISDIQSGETKKSCKNLSMWWGINNLTVLARLPTIDLSHSFPHDLMHLFFENIIPNMVSLWSGCGKWADIDEGSEEYRVPEHIWEQIGLETAAAVKTIPTSFVSHIFNIHDARSSYKAETWAFWFLHLAPILLKGRFPRQKYYDHMCDLISIIHRCIQLEIPLWELDQLESDIRAWVKKYERYYYQYKEDRLPLCPLVVHALLHTPDDIRWTGPGCTSWAFVTERFGGRLLVAIKSKLHPWGTVNNRVIRTARLHQVLMKFDLHDELYIDTRDDSNISSKEFRHEDYPQTILRYPRKANVSLHGDLARRIEKHFSRVFSISAPEIRTCLPQTVTKWGKVRIADGGDLIRTSSAAHHGEELRDASFVRYSAMVANPRAYRGEAPMSRIIGYGQLNAIYEIIIPVARRLNLRTPTLYLLADLTPCNTNGRNAASEAVFYSTTKAPTIINLLLVENVIGRVKRGSEWGIIDRSSAEARTIFVEREDDNADIDN